MEVDQKLILVSNAGSASRKYGLFSGDKCLAKIHFEHDKDKIVYSLQTGSEPAKSEPAKINHLTFAASKVWEILQSQNVIADKDQIKAVAVRVVAPSDYFQKDRILDTPAQQHLKALEVRAPIHINATLQEIHALAAAFPEAKLVGISDSAFHELMPDHAKLYALPSDIPATLEVRRFGYHGLSAEAVIDALRAKDKLPKRLVICHLGSGVSITAVLGGKSVDTTMGYSPLEGLMMGTRSGNVDITAMQVLQDELNLSNAQLQDLLNLRSGLLGVSRLSSDVRELLHHEARSKHVKLALQMFVGRIQQAIGQMAATLGGIDALVFTGTIGERSDEIRKRILGKLMFLGLTLDPKANHETKEASGITRISPPHHPAAIYVISSDEDLLISKKAAELLSGGG